MVYELKIFWRSAQQSLRVKSLALALTYAHALSDRGYVVTLKRVKE